MYMVMWCRYKSGRGEKTDSATIARQSPMLSLLSFIFNKLSSAQPQVGYTITWIFNSESLFIILFEVVQRAIDKRYAIIMQLKKPSSLTVL